jgi:hypothetical protein
MWIAIIAAAVVIAFVWLVKTGTMARGLRREHFAELLNRIAQRKAAARGLELEAPADAAGAAAAGIVTSIGVVMLWTARRDGDVYVHHLSISGRGPPWSFRGMLCAFVLDRLGLKGDSAVSARSPSGVDHLRIEVPVAEHEAMWNRPLRPVPDTAFSVYVMDLRKLRDSIRRVEWAESPFADS